MLRVRRARKRPAILRHCIPIAIEICCESRRRSFRNSGGQSPKLIEVRMAFCSSCGKQSEPDDHFCQSCGKPIASAAPNVQAAPAASQNIPAQPSTPHSEIVIPVHPMTPVAPVPPAAATVFCHACGKQAPAGYEFCESCGAPLRWKCGGSAGPSAGTGAAVCPATFRDSAATKESSRSLARRDFRRACDRRHRAARRIVQRAKAGDFTRSIAHRVLAITIRQTSTNTLT